MKKLFISQPMKGKTNEEIEAERPLWFLGKSIELLSVADAAYFAKDLDKYRGCKIEHSCAVEYGIKVIEYVEG